MPKPLKNETKKDYISRCVKYMIDEEGREQKQALAICFSMWDKEHVNESTINHMDNWLQMRNEGPDFPIKDFIDAIGRVHFRQFSNTDDMLEYAKVYFDDFNSTFRKNLNWDEFSENLTKYWISHIFGK